MAQELSLIEVLRQAPSIRVFRLQPFLMVENIFLKPAKRDQKHKPLGVQFIEGRGTKRNPYQYAISRDVSPHFAVVDLWFRFHNSGPVYIKVNDWLLRAGVVGVIAEDGHFTNLLPSS